MRDIDRLKDVLLQRMSSPGKYETSVEGFSLSRRDETGLVDHGLHTPSIGLVVQGEKRSLVGSGTIVHGEGQCFAISVDMPGSCFVSRASGDTPFLAAVLVLDTCEVSRLAGKVCAADSGQNIGRGVVTAEADAPLLNAFLRLTELSGRDDADFLAGLVVQEIYYRLLTGPLGTCLRKVFLSGTRGNQIAGAIAWMRANYAQPLRVEELARRVHMGTSTFHKYFKEMTMLSPLQYHKRLRLYEAQRLMLSENMDAMRAGLTVGYESQTQFSREYKRLFGEPPCRDIRRRR